jgi:hypothetical protein
MAASLAVQPVGQAAVEARLAVADSALYKEDQVNEMAWMHHCGGLHTLMLRCASHGLGLIADKAHLFVSLTCRLSNQQQLFLITTHCLHGTPVLH